MTKRNLLALMVWAIDTDSLGLPVEKVIEKFKETAVRAQDNFMDHEDKLLFYIDVKRMNPFEFFTDYILLNAKLDINHKYRDYGNLSKSILNS